MNAPGTPYCMGCVPYELPDFKLAEFSPDLKGCANCGGYHGVFGGQQIQCIDLQNGFNRGLQEL